VLGRLHDLRDRRELCSLHKLYLKPRFRKIGTGLAEIASHGLELRGKVDGLEPSFLVPVGMGKRVLARTLGDDELIGDGSQPLLLRNGFGQQFFSALKLQVAIDGQRGELASDFLELGSRLGGVGRPSAKFRDLLTGFLSLAGLILRAVALGIAFLSDAQQLCTCFRECSGVLVAGLGDRRFLLREIEGFPAQPIEFRLQFADLLDGGIAIPRDRVELPAKTVRFLSGFEGCFSRIFASVAKFGRFHRRLSEALLAMARFCACAASRACRIESTCFCTAASWTNGFLGSAVAFFVALDGQVALSNRFVALLLDILQLRIGFARSGLQLVDECADFLGRINLIG